ncbi:MAG: toll/interleukin-1 receptor domain-containing protein [Rhizobacter sp.]|nr:toll/interleukin-1 receptor domain-containing protein [Rhizobacter sp.]
MLQLVTPEPAPVPSPSGDRPAFRYGAFLSYSHHDKAIARRLQRQLETYRVPRRLVGRETALGPVPPRMAPVFRDRDELHAGADLKASVQEALTRSRWLIVVCTPDAARSPWVNREIIEFKKLHGERRVLALIARGEPFASDKPGLEAAECFPPALRRALNAQGVPEGEPLEPIAADMRREGDGPHRATLKLLAGMLGVSFDDLVRRDVQRRVRWLTAIASASALGVVVLAFLSVLAVRARNDAQYQRQQAEGLIEFMLGDLRKKLEPVGRLEVLDSVGEKALAYYGAQEAGKLDATALGHRSRAMHLIGEIRDLRGQPAEAQKAFEQAAETTGRLLAQSPNDGQRIFDHAQSVFWVGYAAWKRADGRTAEANFNEYLALAQRLVALDPANLDWRAEVAFAHANLGLVQLGTGRSAVALHSLEFAGDSLTALVADRPDLSFELARNLGWRAAAHQELGDYEAALRSQRAQLAIYRALPGADKNRTAQRGIVNSLDNIARFELALGRAGEAQRSVGEAIQVADTLLVADPKNMLWRNDACVARLLLTEVLSLSRGSAQARQELTAASSCDKQVKAAASLGPRQATSFAARKLRLQLALADPKTQQAILNEARAFLLDATGKLRADAPERTKLAIDLAGLAVSIGQAADPQSAGIEAWSLVVKLLEPYASSADGAVLTPLAQAYAQLGHSDKAIALAARIKASSYRHPVYVEFERQLLAGGAAIR